MSSSSSSSYSSSICTSISEESQFLIEYDEILEAEKLIKPHIIQTNCLASHYQKQFGISVYYKLEIWQNSGSFKERGIQFALLRANMEQATHYGVVIASLGNAAISLAMYASKANIPLTVVMPQSTAISQVHRIQSFGAKVIMVGDTLSDAQSYAHKYATKHKLMFVYSRDHHYVLAAYGSIALEILRDIPLVDAIIIPVGTGGLAAAICAVVKHDKPNCLVYGVQSEAAPAFSKQMLSSEPITCIPSETLASNIAVSEVGPFANATSGLDRMILVKEDSIARAMLHFMEVERLVVEGAAACPLAAILENLVPELKTKTVVCVLTGANTDCFVYTRSLDRGMAAEGRFINIKIALKDDKQMMQFHNILRLRGYNIIEEKFEPKWIEEDTKNIMVELTCQAMSFQHALELKKIIQKAYPYNASLESALFNTERKCPCHKVKNIK